MRVAVITRYFPTSPEPWAGHSAYQTLRFLAQRCELKVFYPESQYPPLLTPKSRAGRNIDFNYGVSAIGDVLTTIGERAGGQRLGGYAVHTASAVLHGNRWTAGFYAQNLLNKFAVTGIRSRQAFVQTVTDINGDPVHVRSYAEEILRPRELGLKFTYSLGE